MIRRLTFASLAFTLLASLAATAAAHDTWIQTNSNLYRPGDVVHVDLLLGNHGNDHRDFKLAGKSLDKVSKANPGFDKPQGHAMELIPLTNPVTPMGPGVPVSVQVIYKGKPMAKARVSFIPRGTTLKAEFDSQYERMTTQTAS